MAFFPVRGASPLHVAYKRVLTIMARFRLFTEGSNVISHESDERRSDSKAVDC